MISVASQLTSLLQGPVLVIARQHLAHKFMIRGQKVSSVAAIQRHFRPQGIHFFFILNRYKTAAALFPSLFLMQSFFEPLFPSSPSSIRVEDDHFFLYASLASGRKTYFVSNDELGDHAEQYPPEVLPLLKQWQRSCQVTWDMKTGSLRVCTMVLE